ncbi:MAG: hypothetical protein DSM106950_46270 [Stigonema ocellatum SAG 48.90 = DSM 106950]|nr:hypothetical protein [Stigonema ocellatum SAG 48.90 = DSM 106950]
MTHQLKKLFTIVLCAVLSFGIIGAKPALAVTFDFNWKGDAGYTAEGSFSYDEEEGNSVITLNKLEFLKITFFDPTNKLIKSYVNVKDGKSTGVDPYLEFNFNTSTKSLVDSFDVGESNTVGENDYYLHGTVGSSFEFRNLDLNVLDSNSGAISVKKKQETSTATLYLAPLSTNHCLQNQES